MPCLRAVRTSRNFDCCGCIDSFTGEEFNAETQRAQRQRGEENPRAHTQIRRVGHPAQRRETQEHRQECLCHKERRICGWLISRFGQLLFEAGGFVVFDEAIY